MSPNEFSAIVPFIILAGSGVLVMLTIGIYRCHGLVYTITLAGIISSFISLIFVYQGGTARISSLMIVDRYALFFSALMLAVGFVISILSYEYLNIFSDQPEEFYILLLIALLGGTVIVASSHFISFLLGLELLSVSLYIMIAYIRDRKNGIEAGIKYLILASVSTAFLLFGISFIYAATGAMTFAAAAAKSAGSESSLFLIAGTALVISGIGFKLGVVPFHIWTPDVYEGAPAPVTAFIACVSKSAILALLIRYFSVTGIQESSPLFLALTLVATFSMVTGNLLALFQQNIKRILAYSSIAHMGYLLVAVLSAGKYMMPAITFYLIVYSAALLGAFGIISLISDSHGEPDTIDAYQGLAWRTPLMSAVFTVMILSLAGIPLTAGFIGKFYILSAGTSSARWFLVIMLILSSAIGIFYYLRLLIVMYKQPEKPASEHKTVPVVSLGGMMLTVLALITLSFGIYPSLLIDLTHFFFNRLY